MARPYSLDLRWRVMLAVDAGDSVDDVAEQFGVTARTIWSWLALRKQSGGVAPRKGAVGPQPKLDAHREKIEAAIKESPSLTLDELRTQLQLPGGRTTLWEALKRWKQSLKKSLVRS